MNEHTEHPASPASDRTAWRNLSLIIGASICVLGLVKACKSPRHEPGRVAAIMSTTPLASTNQPSVPTAQPPMVAAQAAGTGCPYFAVGGASCELAPEPSQWVLADPSAPAGLHLCWRPANKADFKHVWYLDDSGQTKDYDFDHAPGSEHVPGYRFEPVRKMTIFLWLSATPCHA